MIRGWIVVRGKDAGSPDSGSIGASEDAATGGETPPGACLNLRTGALGGAALGEEKLVEVAVAGNRRANVPRVD